MLKLHGRIPVVSSQGMAPYLVTISKNPFVPESVRRTRALLASKPASTSGFRAVLRQEGVEVSCQGADILDLPADYEYLDEGDILRIDPSSGAVRVLFRKRSPHNTILLTEQCNHYCLMCSQPPKKVDDSWLLREAFDLLEIMPTDTVRVGFSGGEPTLYAEGFVDLIRHVKHMLPHTAVDVLTNGRAFHDFGFARSCAAVNHPDLTFGIPIYSDDSARHDYVVQSRGAFDETVRGVLNLKRVKQKVEIRVVIHKQTIDRLVETCEFIARNLLFVDHVALMGLEITGFTRANLDILWIDPFDYKDILSEAVAVLNAHGMNASIYNHQLCVVNRDAEHNYRKSISDWKNEYVDECSGCERIGECGGFFSSSKTYKYSKHIKPFRAG